MIRIRQLALMTCIAALMVALQAKTESSDTDDPGDLLEKVWLSYGKGNWTEAWDSYMMFFAHHDRNDVDMNAWATCFVLTKCPPVGLLGDVLGKSAKKLSVLDGFCPQWRKSKNFGSDEKRILEWEEQLRILHSKMRGGSCTELIRIGRSALDGNEHSFANMPTILPLNTWGQTVNGQWKTVDAGFRDKLVWGEYAPNPSVEYQLGDFEGEMVVDTGSPRSAIHDVPNLPWDSIDSAGSIFFKDIVHDIHEVRLVRLKNLALGESLFPRVSSFLFDDHHPIVVNLMGMNMLLRYSAVCFDWNARRLYLGSIGPCRHGTLVKSAFMEQDLELIVPVMDENSKKWLAWIDTGSSKTACSAGMLGDGRRRMSLEIDNSSDLRIPCENVDDVGFLPVQNALQVEFSQALIAMDSLLEFDAFGWEINPVRIYFVLPKGEQPL